MADTNTGTFEASGPLLGYLYQCRYALLLVLQRLKSEPAVEVSIERFDDVAFEKAGDPHDLVQSKHHKGQPGNLTDASVDLWKTLRVWSEGLKSGVIDASSVLLTLITTAVASPDTAAALLRPNEERDEKQALARLIRIAETSKNNQNATAYKAFLALSDDERLSLVKAIRVLDRSPNISDTLPLIQGELRLSVRPEQVEALRERLEGWWYSQVIDRLMAATNTPILGDSITRKTLDIVEQLRRDALPIDFRHALPPEPIAADSDKRTFVCQLRLIRFLASRLEAAIRDYYRASAQRSRWLRDDPSLADELTNYDVRLIDEWRWRFDREIEDLEGETCPERQVQAARRLFNEIQDLALHVRPNCTEPYVMRGCYHILADGRRVGWHPDFENLLRALEQGEQEQ